MPLIVLTLVAAVVCGLLLSARTAYGITGALCAATLFGFTWAVTDGQGNDPWWLLLVAAAACALALAVVHVLAGHRRHRVA